MLGSLIRLLILLRITTQKLLMSAGIGEKQPRHLWEKLIYIPLYFFFSIAVTLQCNKMINI